jgi:hypothetical protein
MKIFRFLTLMALGFCSTAYGAPVTELTVFTVKQPYGDRIKLESVTKEHVRITGPYYKEEGIILPRKDVVKIVFPGGDDNAKGIVLKNGLIFNGTVNDFTNGKWLVSIDTLKGVMTLEEDDILSMNFTEIATLSTPVDNQLSWKFKNSYNVLEWIYANSEETLFDNDVHFDVGVKKIELTASQIVLTAELYNHGKAENGCFLECRTLDASDQKKFDRKLTAIEEMPIVGATKDLKIECPPPPKNARNIILSLRVAHHGGGCGNREKWYELPSLNLELFN